MRASADGYSCRSTLLSYFDGSGFPFGCVWTKTATALSFAPAARADAVAGDAIESRAFDRFR